MMRTRKILGSVGVVTAAALTLVACGKSNKTASNEGAKTASEFPVETPVKTAKKGGTIKVAEVTDTPFTGVFNEELQMDQPNR